MHICTCTYKFMCTHTQKHIRTNHMYPRTSIRVCACADPASRRARALFLRALTLGLLFVSNARVCTRFVFCVCICVSCICACVRACIHVHRKYRAVKATPPALVCPSSTTNSQFPLCRLALVLLSALLVARVILAECLQGLGTPGGMVMVCKGQRDGVAAAAEQHCVAAAAEHCVASAPGMYVQTMRRTPSTSGVRVFFVECVLVTACVFYTECVLYIRTPSNHDVRVSTN